MGHLQTLLEGVVACPGQPISTLPLLSMTERRQLLGHEHTHQIGPLADMCLHTLFEQQVERTPEAVAVVYEDERLTYAELNRRANHLAQHLRRRGVGPEVLVGLYLERSLELVLGLLATLKAGGAYVPLDPRYPQERLAFLLADTQMPIVLRQHSLEERLPASSTQVLCLDSPQLRPPTTEPETPLPKLDTPAQLAYVIYTSGSTGRPKGVLVSHADGFSGSRIFAIFRSLRA